MLWIIVSMLLGLALSASSAFFLWRQMDSGDVNFGKIILLVWLPGAAGGLTLVISSVLLVARLIKGM